MLTQKQAENFVKTFVTEVWCEQNADKIPEHYAPDFIGIMNGDEPFGYDDLIKRVALSKKSFAENKAEFYDVFIISETRLGARISMHRRDFNGQESHVNICMIIELKDEKVKRIWLFTDQTYRYKGWE